MISDIINTVLPLLGRFTVSNHQAALATIAAEFNLQDAIDTSILSRIREFVPEIRVLIWGHCLCRKPIKNEGNSYTIIMLPTLIKALRPDEILYQEALDVYYKHETFCLKASTYEKFKKLSVGALPRIQKLAININELSGRQLLMWHAQAINTARLNRDPNIADNLNWEFQRLFTDPFSSLTLMTNVTHLELLIKTGNPFLYSVIPILAKVCKKLKYLRIWIQPTSTSQATEREMMEFVLKVMGKKLSFDRELADQTMKRRLSMDYRSWVWREGSKIGFGNREGQE